MHMIVYKILNIYYFCKKENVLVFLHDILVNNLVSAKRALGASFQKTWSVENNTKIHGKARNREAK